MDLFDPIQLHNAVIARDLAQVRTYVDLGPNALQLYDDSGYTPLHAAICTEEAFDIVQLLIEHDADVNQKVRSGVSPLHLAVTTGDVNLVKYLLEARAEIDAFDLDRKTPLHCACYQNHTDIVKLLVSSNAGINYQDSSGSTPLHHAAYLLSQGVIIYEYLVCSGADDTIPNQNGQKPSDLIETWFSESEDSPDARHSDGDETITSYSQLTMTDGDFADLPSPLDDEETDTTLLDDLDEIELAPSSPYSDGTCDSLPSSIGRFVESEIHEESSFLSSIPVRGLSDLSEQLTDLQESDSSLPQAIPHNPFSPLPNSVRMSMRSMVSMPSNPMMMDPIPLNSRSNRHRDQQEPSIRSIELPTTSLSLRSHDFFLGIEDNNGEMLLFSSWSEDNSRPRMSRTVQRPQLPTRIYFEQDECVICKCEWAPKEVIKTLPCSHDFHATCIDQWLSISNSCPVCKQIVPGH